MNMYRSLLIVGAPGDRLLIMKVFFLILALALGSSIGRAEDWTTTDGTKYQDVHVVRVEDDAVTIIYKDGGALVYLYKLPPDLQQKFNYDPVKAKAAMELRAKSDSASAKELQAEIELSEKMKKAQEIKYSQERSATNTPSH